MLICDGMPLVRCVHVAPASVLLKTPSVPAYTVDGFARSMAMLSTQVLSPIPASASLQEAPPSVLLRTPARPPAYRICGFVGWRTRLSTSPPSGPRDTHWARAVTPASASIPRAVASRDIKVPPARDHKKVARARSRQKRGFEDGGRADALEGRRRWPRIRAGPCAVDPQTERAGLVPPPLLLERRPQARERPPVLRVASEIGPVHRLGVAGAPGGEQYGPESMAHGLVPRWWLRVREVVFDLDGRGERA